MLRDLVFDTYPIKNKKTLKEKTSEYATIY